MPTTTDARLLLPGQSFTLAIGEPNPSTVYTARTIHVKTDNEKRGPYVSIGVDCRANIPLLLNVGTLVTLVPPAPRLHTSFISETGEWVCSIEAPEPETLVLDLNELPIWPIPLD